MSVQSDDPGQGAGEVQGTPQAEQGGQQTEQNQAAEESTDLLSQALSNRGSKASEGDGGAEGGKPAENSGEPAEGEPKEGEPKEGEAEEGNDTPEGKPEGEAPDEYEDFTLPEGVTLNEEFSDWFKDKAKSLGLNQEKAQDLVTDYVELLQKQAKENSKAELEAQAKYKDELQAEFRKDPNHKITLDHVGRTSQEFLNESEREFLLGNPILSNHPVVLGLLARISDRFLKEDSPPGGGGGGESLRTPGERAADTLFKDVVPKRN